ncbi:MAG: glycosyltransferase family 39 protein [Anaerolineales bacterium]|nr:glycosyltransferase family 39 protein [Anaerolineales bacterium]
MKKNIRASALMGGILALAFFLRIRGANYGLPYVYHPDEPLYINISQNIFKSGDLNPHFFLYPSLFFYINAFAYIPYYLAGKLAGIFVAPNSIAPCVSLGLGIAQTMTPSAVTLGRVVTICFGVATCALIYLAGRQLTGRAEVGALAALITAISPTNIEQSRLITPDTFVAFFSMTAFLAAILIYQQGKTWQSVMAGICVGLTASSKYNGGLIILPVILAYFLRYGRTTSRQPKVYLTLFFCAAGFLLTTPYALFDSAKFLNELRYEAHHYATGHLGMEGNTLAWYVNYLWNTNGGIYLFAVFGIFLGLASRSREYALLSIFPLSYFTFISNFVVRNERTLLPITPFLFLLAAWFLITLIDKIASLPASPLRNLSFAFFACATIAAFSIPIAKTAEEMRRFNTIHSIEAARVWINGNLPQGAKIAIESYSPFIDTTRFSWQSFLRMNQHEPDWYVEQGFDYMVMSEGMYGRFYLEPDRYPTEIEKYDRLFDTFEALKFFDNNGYEIRIYKVR